MADRAQRAASPPRPARRKTLSERDVAVWAEYVRMVRPLAGHVPPEPPPAPAPVAEQAAAPVPATAPLAAPRRPAPELEIGLAPGGVDAASWRRFRGGKLAAVRTLDLHGSTAQRAHAALHAFLHAAQADGVRCVEVITGRGTQDGTGVLRRELPHWLNQAPLRAMILGAAHPHARNPGSVRLLLRRPR
jgi:DNA-nicking Smr family endonuclease